MKIRDLIDRLDIIEMKNYDEDIFIKGIAFHSFKPDRRDLNVFIEETITCYIYFIKCNKCADDIKLPY